MRVFSIICSVIVIAVPTFSFIYTAVKGREATSTRKEYVKLSLLPSIVLWAASMALLWGAGVFKNFF